MKATNQQNREQKNALDRLEIKIALNRAMNGGDYHAGYVAGYDAGKRAAEAQLTKLMGRK